MKVKEPLQHCCKFLIITWKSCSDHLKICISSWFLNGSDKLTQLTRRGHSHKSCVAGFNPLTAVFRVHTVQACKHFLFFSLHLVHCQLVPQFYCLEVSEGEHTAQQVSPTQLTPPANFVFLGLCPLSQKENQIVGLLFWNWRRSSTHHKCRKGKWSERDFPGVS